MAIDANALAAALARFADRMDEAAPELNRLDGRLGDGDLGATLQKCAANIRASLPGMEGSDVSGVFKAGAIACTKASGSSFGTLLAVAFLTAAKETVGKAELASADVGPLLEKILAALMQRGGASLGDKTVLDTLDAAAKAVAGAADQKTAAAAATEATITAFRDKPNRIGRARMFAEQSVGMDDPGMIAFRHIVASL